MKKLSINLWLLLVLVFSGCSSKTMTSSLFDINTEYDIDGWPWYIQQVRLMNIHPGTPLSELGGVYYLTPSRGQENALPLKYNANLTKQVIDYQNEETSYEDLNKIKNQILKIDEVALQIAEKEIKLLKEIDDTKKTVIQEEIDELQCKYDTEYKKLLNEENKKGIIIVQWTKSEETNFGVVATELNNINYSKGNNLNGFIIASGIKIETLILDKELARGLQETFNDTLFHRVGINSYMMTAEKYVFANRKDNKKLLDIALKVDVKKLSNTFENIDKLSLALSLAKVNKLFGGGGFTNRKFYKCTKNQSNYVWKNGTKNCDNTGTPIFNVFTEIDYLDDLFK